MTVLEIDNVTKATPPGPPWQRGGESRGVDPAGEAQAPDEAVTPDETRAPATREVRHEYTHTLPALLNELGVSLLVSTYQAGKVVVVGVAALLQRDQLGLQRLHALEPGADLAELRGDQRIHLHQGLGVAAAQAVEQQRDVRQRHVQRAAVPDEGEPLQMGVGVVAIAVLAARGRR